MKTNTTKQIYDANVLVSTSLIKDHINKIKQFINSARDQFLKIGKELYLAREDQSFKILGYQSIDDFALDVFGFKKTSTYNYINVFEKFATEESKKDKLGYCSFCELKKEAKGFGFQQLVEISSQSDKIETFNPEMTIAETKLQKVINKFDKEKNKVVNYFKNDIYNFLTKLFTESKDSFGVYNFGKVMESTRYSNAFEFYFTQRSNKITFTLRLVNNQYYLFIGINYCLFELIEKSSFSKKKTDEIENKFFNDFKLEVSIDSLMSAMGRLVPALIAAFKQLVIDDLENKEFQEKEKEKLAKIKAEQKLKTTKDRESFVVNCNNWDIVFSSKEHDIILYVDKFAEHRFYVLSRFYDEFPSTIEGRVFDRYSYYSNKPNKLMPLADSYATNFKAIVNYLKEINY